ncbi:MAG TPA: glycosyltransferase family 39 protein [Polyangiaceae bacterium]
MAGGHVAVTPIRVVVGFALLKLVVQACVLRPYGFFRDELYYVACSEHLAWGYVDHPPLSVAILKGWRLAFGDSLTALRLGPALAGAAVVALTGMTAIELGGGTLAVILACLSVVAAPAFLIFHHLWSMNAFDQVFWIAAALLAVRAVKRGTAGSLPWQRSARPWVALGVVLGLGLLDKWSILWFGAGLLVALVATPARRVLRTPGPYAAGAIALLLFAPHVLWEVRHGWPTLEFMHNALGDKYVPLSAGEFAVQQALIVNPVTVPLSVAAFVHAARRRKADDGALLVVLIFATTLAILLVSKGAKPEYIVAAYPMLFACGGVGVETAVAAWRRRSVALLTAAYAAPLVGLAAVMAPFVLPVLSEERFVRYQAALGQKPTTSERKELAELPQHYADMHGWPELVDAVGAVFTGLPADDRARATLWSASGGYGSAAALDFFGRAYGLPPARCSHNNYWLWGPGDGDGSVVVIVGGARERFAPLFASLEQVATFECRWCMPYENHKPIYVGRGMRPTLRERWPDMRHYE